jgi:hypothetical protein
VHLLAVVKGKWLGFIRGKLSSRQSRKKAAEEAS